MNAPLEVETPFEDERIRLMLLCTHPAIDRSIQTPLMLQLLLGLNAEEMTALYLVSASTLSQNLVRTMQKFRLAGIEPQVPEEEELTTRFQPVLAAL